MAAWKNISWSTSRQRWKKPPYHSVDPHFLPEVHPDMEQAKGTQGPTAPVFSLKKPERSSSPFFSMTWVLRA